MKLAIDEDSWWLNSNLIWATEKFHHEYRQYGNGNYSEKVTLLKLWKSTQIQKVLSFFGTKMTGDALGIEIDQEGKHQVSCKLHSAEYIVL